MLAQTFREARELSGLTQAQLAKKCGYTSPQYVSNWERGLTNPPLSALPKLCRFLKIDTKKITTIMVKNYEKEINAIFKN